MRCGASRPQRPTSIKMALASGTPRSPRSRSWPRIVPSSSTGIPSPTRWRKNWTSGYALTCGRTGTSRASIHCPARAPTCPTISMQGWWCCPRTIRTARSPATRLRRQRGRSWSCAATRLASTATRWFFLRRIGRDCKTCTGRYANSLRGSRSWRRRRRSILTRTKCGRRRRRGKQPTVR